MLRYVLFAAVAVAATQGKADEWRRSWGLKASMAYELYIHLANVMKVRVKTHSKTVLTRCVCLCVLPVRPRAFALCVHTNGEGRGVSRRASRELGHRCVLLAVMVVVVVLPRAAAGACCAWGVVCMGVWCSQLMAAFAGVCCAWVCGVGSCCDG
jgi:hypothetical protein